MNEAMQIDLEPSKTLNMVIDPNAPTDERSEEAHALLMEKLLKRIEIGQSLRLDVNAPNEAIDIQGRAERLRDELGLRLDTSLYASKKCKDCHGRGIRTYVKHVPGVAIEQLKKENPANLALLHPTKQFTDAEAARAKLRKEGDEETERYVPARDGDYVTKESSMCGCAMRGYEKAHRLLGDAFVEAKLATRVTEGQKPGAAPVYTLT